MKQSVETLLAYEKKILEERLEKLALFENRKTLVGAYEFINKMADSFALTFDKMEGVDTEISEFEKGSAIAYSLCVDILKPFIDNSCHIILYADEFKEDNWATYMEKLGENKQRKTVRLDVIKPLEPQFKKVPFKEGDKVIIRGNGKIVKVVKVLDDGERYEIEDDYKTDDTDDIYFFGDLVKF